MAYMVTATSQFGIIDLTTGVFRLLGNTVTPPLGLGRTPDGKLYTSDSSGTVYQVNPASGSLTMVGHNGVANFGLCSTTGGLYALDTSLNLYSINANTGAATKIGPSGINLNSSAPATTGCSAGSDALYLTYGPSYGPGTLYSVSTTTGVATAIGMTGVDGVAALVFEDGVLYGGSNWQGTTQVDAVYALNRTSGTGSFVANVSRGADRIWGLAPAPPPSIIAHLANAGDPANGGQWSTTILLVSADTHTASYQLNFHNEVDGSPLVLPFLKYGPQSSVTGTLAPGQLAVIQTDGSGSALVEGWAELVTPDAIGGTGIFTDLGLAGNRQEAAVPLNSGGGTQMFIPFDETSGSVVFATGIALVDPGTSPANVNVTFIDDSGNIIPTATRQVALNPGAHKAFVLTAPGYFPEVSGKRGAVQFTSNVPIYGLGIRFNGTAFTSIGAIVPGAR